MDSAELPGICCSHTGSGHTPVDGIGEQKYGESAGEGTSRPESMSEPGTQPASTARVSSKLTPAHASPCEHTQQQLLK